MMENYDRTIELIDTAYSSAGRSSEQFAKYQDTVEYKLKQLSNTWEQLRTSFLSSDAYKGLIDLANSFIDTINDMDLTQLLTVGTIGLTLGRSVVLQFIDGLRSSTNLITNTWNDVLKKSLDKMPTGKIFTKLSNKINSSLLSTATNALTNVGVNQTLAEGSAQALINYVKITQELMKIKTEYNDLKSKGDLLTKEEKERLSFLKQQSEEIREQRLLQAKQLNENGITRQQLNAATRDKELNKGVGRNNFYSNSLSTIKTNFSMAASNAISAALTTALITGISGADLSTVLTTAFISAITAAAPSIISTLISVVAGSVPLLIAAIATAAIVGITALVVHIQKEQERAEAAELERLASVKKANEEMRKQNENAISSYKKSLSEQEKYEEALKNVQQLQDKKFLTSQEQETLDNAVSFLQDNYEGVLEQDELTGHFNIIETKLEEIEENTRDEQQKDIAQVRGNLGTQLNLLNDTKDEAARLIDEMRTSKLTDRWGSSAEGVEYSSYYGFSGDKDENGNSLVYARADIGFDVVKEQLKSLKTIYGEGLDLNAIFNMSDFEELLYADLDSDELRKTLEQNHITSKTIEQKIDVIEETLKSIDKTREEEFAREATKEVLLLQGWDETSAAIASYSQQEFALSQAGSKISFESGFENEPDRIAFLKNIKEGNFATLFDTNADLAKQAFAIMGYGERQNKSLKDLFSSGSNIAKWDELTPELQTLLKGQVGKDWEKNWDKTFGGRKSSTKMAEAIIQAMSDALIKETELLEEETQKEFERDKAKYDKFAETLSDTNDKTWSEYSKEIDDIVDSTSGNTHEAMENYRNAVESNYAMWKGYVDALTGGTGDSPVFLDPEMVNKLDFASAQYLNEQLSDLELSDFGYARLSEYINSAFSDLNGKALNILANIPINDIVSLTVESSRDYIDRLTEATGSAEEATKIFYDYINSVQFISRKGAFLGKDSTTIYREQLLGQLGGLKENFKSVLEASDEMLENQVLSSDTYFQLLEDGFEDYVDITTDGYTLLQDKAEEAWVSMAMASRDSVRENIKQQNALISEAESLSVEEGINDIIKAYKDAKEANKEITADMFGDLKQEQIDLVKFIAENGYETAEAYLAALREGKAELNTLEEEAYAQGLILIQEQAEKTKEEIDELKEKVEDLNEELADLNVELEEAEDELRQAKHGSDDFRSSLDGLINYTQKLEELNSSIEKTKESLEDVANIDEAKGLLSQLNEQYNNKTITLGAENIAIDKALNNLQSTLLENYGNYISFDENGNAMIDFAYQTLDANDEIRKAFEQEYELYNQYKKKKEENLDEINAIEKEKQERRKETLNNFVQVQEDVISILKEQAQEEIDTTKEKYDALEAADNEYLDALEEAIAKQRELREQQDKYDDLATKEKKLSLLQRDTSSANQKEVLSLESEIQDDRQELLDNEVDNLIESMRELYEKQKEARDSEIEYMEEVTENAQYFADWASNIMSTWQSVEDMQSWYLQNDPNAQDMTVEQTEVYLNEIGEKYSNYVSYIATLATDFTADQEALNEAMVTLYENTSNNIENIGTVEQTTAENTAAELIAKATEARDKIIDKIKDTEDKIAEAEEKLSNAEKNSVMTHEWAMNAMVQASQEAMETVSILATKFLIESSEIDFNNPEEVKKWAKEHNLMTADNKASMTLIRSMEETGFDTSWMTSLASEIYNIYSRDDPSSSILATARSEREATQKAKDMNIANPYWSLSPISLTAQEVYGGVEKNNKPNSDSNNIGATEFSPDFYYEVFFPPLTTGGRPSFVRYNESTDAYEAVGEWNAKYPNNPASIQFKKYATGGLVDYTGPAWVDGTRNKPEAFLNAKDTQRIGEAAKILADIPLLNSTSNAQNAVSTNIGDTTIEIHINVENVSSDYDVDRMLDRVKQDIIDVSKPIGTPVILRK